MSAQAPPDKDRDEEGAADPTVDALMGLVTSPPEPRRAAAPKKPLPMRPMPPVPGAPVAPRMPVWLRLIDIGLRKELQRREQHAPADAAEPSGLDQSWPRPRPRSFSFLPRPWPRSPS